MPQERPSQPQLFIQGTREVTLAYIEYADIENACFKNNTHEVDWSLETAPQGPCSLRITAGEYADSQLGTRDKNPDLPAQMSVRTLAVMVGRCGSNRKETKPSWIASTETINKP